MSRTVFPTAFAHLADVNDGAFIPYESNELAGVDKRLADLVQRGVLTGSADLEEKLTALGWTSGDIADAKLSDLFWENHDGLFRVDAMVSTGTAAD